MAGIKNGTLVGKNADFTQVDAPNGQSGESNGLVTDGKLWIGSTATNVGGTHINVGSLTSPLGTITVGYLTPNITLDLAGGGEGIDSVGVDGATAPGTNPVVPTIAGQIDVLGSKAFTTNVTFTNSTLANTLYVEDRTYLSQYVVDASTTAGLRGTFQTIQAALDQIVTDGTGSGGAIAAVYVRHGTYTETVTLAANQKVNIIACSADDYLTALNATVNISGNVITSSGSKLAFFGVYFSDDTKSITVNGDDLALNYCLVKNHLIAVDPATISITNSSLADFAIPANTSMAVWNSTFLQNSTLGGFLIANYCDFGNIGITVSDPGYFSIIGCQNVGVISGTTTSLANLVQNSTIASQSTITADVIYNNLGAAGSYSPSNFFSSAVTARFFQQTQGNVLQSVRSAVSYLVLTTDYYIGITNTGAIRTVTLPDPATIFPNQVFVVKDESGGAATNNITVIGAAGTIDGAASKLIAANYGSMRLISNGTNYFII